MTDWHVSEHNTLRCRVCNAWQDAAAGYQQRPRTGDFSICIHCNEVSVFEVADDGTISMREPNFVELAAFQRQHSNAALKAIQFRLDPHSGYRPPFG